MVILPNLPASLIISASSSLLLDEVSSPTSKLSYGGFKPVVNNECIYFASSSLSVTTSTGCFFLYESITSFNINTVLSLLVLHRIVGLSTL